jgi:hypothetical protein
MCTPIPKYSSKYYFITILSQIGDLGSTLVPLGINPDAISFENINDPKRFVYPLQSWTSI